MNESTSVKEKSDDELLDHDGLAAGVLPTNLGNGLSTT